MKYALILPDGAADEPIPELDGQTPLEAANIPNMDWVSTNGRQGTVVTVPQGFAANTDVATMSVLGYDPRKYYTGRGPVEAVALGIELGPTDVVVRCNLVTIVDGEMIDFSAGHIGSPEAARIIEDLNEQVAPDGVRFYPGVSYRHLMVIKGGADLRAECTAPHDIPNKPVARYLPKGRDGDRLRSIMDRAASMLADHDVNAVRRDLGESPATDIWLWGYGQRMSLPSFEERFGVQGGAIAAVDVIRGLALAVGFELIEVVGATGYLDTNYRGKGDAAVAALDDYDFVVVHVEAADEAGHNGDAAAKIEALERIDEHIVGPVLSRIQAFDRWKIMIAPDHPTPVGRRTHTATPPPFCLAGEGVVSVLARAFSEANGQLSDLHCDPGHELIEYLLKK
ncbi:MAG: cofactor-independent phosphoglycerate mutase [bacterium]|nr:cofactor-independent phosphoglycerate mutase [bacterium]